MVLRFPGSAHEGIRGAAARAASAGPAVWQGGGAVLLERPGSPLGPFARPTRTARSSLAHHVALAALAASGALGCSPETTLDTSPDDLAAESALEPVGAAAHALEETPAWAVTGAMTQARQLFVSSLLADGKVLVAGGWRVGAVDTGNVYFQSGELFDPATGTFTVLDSKMSQKRLQHAAVPFPGGRVLIVGGAGDTLSATTAEVFVPSTKKFQNVSTLAHQRIAATVTVLLSGDILAAGGDEAPGRTAEILDPATMTWTPTALMVTPRRSHTATRLAGGRVLVTGGVHLDNAILSTAEIFKPTTGTWEPVASMSVARAAHTATLLASGHVLVTGGTTQPASAELGASVELYDPVADTWTTLAPMEQARALHTATLLGNGAVLVAGGVDETSSIARTTELFDPATLRWVPVGLMSHGRLSHTAVLLADGAVLAAGGEHQSSAEIYRSAADGQPCEVDTQCGSSHCVDGVCCNDACTGHCVTCLLPGSEGNCSLAAPGTDPHGDCGGDGPCDDVCGEGGVCTDRVGEICVTPACNEDGTHAIAQATCTSVGDACAQTVVDCTPYRCGPTGPSEAPGCRDTCTSIDDCAAGYACDPEGKCRPRPDVAATDPEACTLGSGGPGASPSPTSPASPASPASPPSTSSSRAPVPPALALILAALALAAARRSPRRPS